MFEQIKNDPYIINLYNEIELLEQDGGLWHNHSFLHINSVINTVETILLKLNYSEDIIERAKVAALLHDIGCIKGKEDHAKRSYDMAKEYFIKNNIETNDNDEILEAIKLHGTKEKVDNDLAKILIFADKLDIKKDRITEVGKTVDVVKESQYIEDIIVDINDEKLIVNFIANKKINKKVFDTYYFLPKVFSAIEHFADYISLKPEILFNGEKWMITSSS